MIQRQPLERHVSARLFVPVWAAAGLAVSLAVGLPGLLDRPSLEASVQASSTGGLSPDFDGDGLADALERLLGTQIDQTDTDDDGYSDSEELARRTSPTRASAAPLGRQMSLGMTVFGYEGTIHVLTALYLDGCELSDVSFHMGALINGQLRTFSSEMTSTDMRVSVVPAVDARDMVVLVDYPVPPELVHGLGGISFFAAAGSQDLGYTQTADVVDLVSHDGVILHRTKGLNGFGNAPFMNSQSQGGGSQLGPAGVIYNPIPLSREDGEADLPLTWTPSKICAQRSVPVGASGAVVTHEVVAADCVEDWDAFCSPDCSASVGDTYQTIDPVSLVGG